VRVACRLFRLLLSLPEGRDYPFFHELVDEIFVALLSEAGKEPTSLPPTPRAGARTTAGFPTKEPESPQDPKRSVGILQSLTGSSTPQPKAPKISKQIEYKFRCLSRSHVAKKLSREYFTLLGTRHYYLHFTLDAHTILYTRFYHIIMLSVVSVLSVYVCICA
jgi:hypothetical protein